MSMVLDSSAVLAMLLHEPGGDRVRSALGGAVINAVNLSEVYAKSVEKALDADAVRKAFTALSISIVPFDDAHAFIAGKLRQQTRDYGLSLGDRACLATAMIERRPVLTADRAWLKLGLDIEITAIR